MGLFDSLSKEKKQGMQTPMQMLQDLKYNPVNTLSQAGYTIPDGMNDPMQIVQHLVTSGQVTQKRYSQIMQMMGRR